MIAKSLRSQFRIFTTLLLKKCDQTNNLNRDFANLLSWSRVKLSTSCWKTSSGMRPDEQVTILRAFILSCRCLFLYSEKRSKWQIRWSHDFPPSPSTIIVANPCICSRQAASFLNIPDEVSLWPNTEVRTLPTCVRIRMTSVKEAHLWSSASPRQPISSI